MLAPASSRARARRGPRDGGGWSPTEGDARRPLLVEVEKSWVSLPRAHSTRRSAAAAPESGEESEEMETTFAVAMRNVLHALSESQDVHKGWGGEDGVVLELLRALKTEVCRHPRTSY